MKKVYRLGWLIGGLLLASTAYATSYTIQFTTLQGTAPASGGFTYSTTPTPSFSAFTVVWDGITFDLTSGPLSVNDNTQSRCGLAGAPGSFSALSTCWNGGTWSAYGGNGSLPATFSFVPAPVSGGQPDPAITGFVHGPLDQTSAGGSWSITGTTTSKTPEPSYAALLAAALIALMIPSVRLRLVHRR
jgi:hypothetical protein